MVLSFCLSQSEVLVNHLTMNLGLFTLYSFGGVEGRTYCLIKHDYQPREGEGV